MLRVFFVTFCSPCSVRFALFIGHLRLWSLILILNFALISVCSLLGGQFQIWILKSIFIFCQMGSIFTSNSCSLPLDIRSFAVSSTRQWNWTAFGIVLSRIATIKILRPDSCVQWSMFLVFGMKWRLNSGLSKLRPAQTHDFRLILWAYGYSAC